MNENLNFNKNALEVLKKRYLLRNDEGEIIESVSDMFRRVSDTVAEGDREYGSSDEEIKKLSDKFYNMMINKDFMPNSPTLMNAGKSKGQLSACFVLPIEDSLDGIFETMKNAALIHKSGGGTGFSFSNIRPKNDNVKTTMGISSGPVSFMTMYNSATEVVKQGSAGRKGANIGVLRIDHPDILEFINCKNDLSQLTNFNISVGITDKFMDAVKNNTDYELINPRTKEVVDTLNAVEVFNNIVENAWKNGEPGIIFLDRINKDNPTPDLGDIESTNPCFSGNMRLLTEDGYKKFEELVGDKNLFEKIDVQLYSPDIGDYVTGKVWCSGYKDVYKLNLSDGTFIECTEDHVFRVIKTTGFSDSVGRGINRKIVGFSCSYYVETKAKDTVDKYLVKYNPIHCCSDDILYPIYRSENPKVINIEYIGKQKVYDFSEPYTNWGVVEGIIVHNCGEVPLLPYEACNLGSINLSNMIKEEDGKTKVDYYKLGYTVDLATHFLDNVITVNNFPLKQIEDMVKGNRKIGLGVMGWAELLIKLGIPYNSEEAVKLGKYIMYKIDECSKYESMNLSVDNGKFPNYNLSLYDKFDNYFFNKDPIENSMLLDISLNKHGIRNATTTCIAPTGTISIICGTTGGIEPLYSVAYTRNIMEGTELVEVNSEFERISKERGFYSEELMKKIAKEGSIQNIDEIPDDIKKIFVTAHDIDPEYHVKMQASFQEFTDNAVSKTVNFNNNATKEEIFKTYMLAYELGLKGITVYRDGSRMFQPMSVKKEVTDQDSTHDNVVTVHNKPRVRPHTTHGKTEKINTGCGSLFITVNRDDVGLSEVFISMGKSGGCPTSQSEAIGRLISLSLRSNVSIKEVVDQLKGIRCPNPTLGKGCMVLSCSDAISKVLEKYIDDENNDKKVKLSISDVGVCPECPECSTMLQIKEGCISCPSCGYSKCG